ncbi:hypothetical protein BHE90_006933 [Fusarium euwallaceae]|uniref:Uncharacterized protein n=1 Tax=Fusarium euwallaceae TaxID=1147111 RepID=A0A430LSD4_9HYPO|nr:hypothetical protein BHE90_006933 [Fusarium euwallaceae]
MGFNRLPPEILLRICELLCDDCQGWWDGKEPTPVYSFLQDPYTSLRALSLVCKSIGYIAQRVLHRHFGYGLRDDSKSIVQLCRTVSNNPNLARELRWVDLSLPDCDTAPEEVVEGWLPETINKLSHHLVNGGEGIPDMPLLIALILLQAPNIERLEDDRNSLHLTFEDVIRDHTLPPRLKQLRLGSSIHVINDLITVDLSWDRVGGFINNLKELESLIIYCPLASGVDERISFESLRALRLRGFHMPPKDLENLLSRIPNLETFGFNRIYHRNYEMPEPATGPEILRVLVKRNDTLRRLELNMSCTHDNVKALLELTKLEELRMGLGASHRNHYSRGRAIGKQYFKSIMPPSLRKLHLVVYKTETFEETSDALMTYISSTYRQSPDDQRLQMVHINPPEYSTCWAADQEDAFQQGCQLWAKNGTLVFEHDWTQWYCR